MAENVTDKMLVKLINTSIDKDSYCLSFILRLNDLVNQNKKIKIFFKTNLQIYIFML